MCFMECFCCFMQCFFNEDFYVLCGEHWSAFNWLEGNFLDKIQRERVLMIVCNTMWC